MGRFDIALLPALRASCEQNDQRLAVAAELQAIARPEIEAPLENATSYTLHVGQIAER